MGIENIEGKKTIKSISVRTVIKNQNEYLMVSTKRGDLIFPGGKIEFGETHEEAAARELLEETGYRAKGKMKYLGKIFIRRKDRYEANCLYESEMFYYLCDVDNEISDRKLSENEIINNIEPIWLEKLEIIARNQKYNATLDESDVWTEMVKFILENIEE